MPLSPRQTKSKLKLSRQFNWSLISKIWPMEIMFISNFSFMKTHGISMTHFRWSCQTLSNERSWRVGFRVPHEMRKLLWQPPLPTTILALQWPSRDQDALQNFLPPPPPPHDLTDPYQIIPFSKKQKCMGIFHSQWLKSYFSSEKGKSQFPLKPLLRALSTGNEVGEPWVDFADIFSVTERAVCLLKGFCTQEIHVIHDKCVESGRALKKTCKTTYKT